MAMGTERSKALHNFTMPCGLRWGNQRFLRCMKVNSTAQSSHRRSPSDHHHPIQQRHTSRERDKDSPLHFLHESATNTPPYHRRKLSRDAVDGGIAATREKVMLDLQTAADRMKDAIFKDRIGEGEASAQAEAEADGETCCPWNLRTRRASCRTAATGFLSGGGGGDVVGGKSFRVDVPKSNTGSSQLRAAVATEAVTAAAASSGGKRERAELTVALSKRDIEEDFNAMVGHRPPRRPKKRARIVQKQLDTLFPALWLTEVTPEMYKVIEATR